MADIFTQARKGVARAMSAFQDAPRAPTPPRRTPRRVAAVAEGSPLIVNPITADKLKPGAPRVGEFSVVGYFPVPAGVIARIPEGRQVRLYPKAQAKAEASAGSFFVDTPGILQSLQRQPTLPAAFHPDISAWVQVRGTWQRARIVGINYDAGTVEVEAQGSSAGDAVEVYYLHGDGEYRLRVYRELGVSDTSAATVLNGSVASAILVDQNNAETMMRWPVYTGLIPSQRLALEINSSLPHVVNKRAEHVLHITAYTQKVRVTDAAELRRRAEIDMRGGL